MMKTPARAALAEDRDGFRFRGGHVALDLTATLQARLKPAPRELLAGPEDLDRWFVSAGLTEASAGAREADVVTARRLREAVFTLAEGVGGRATDADARSALNRIAATPAAAPVLRADGRYFMEGSAAALLSFVARQAVHLLGGDAAGPVRQCQSETCTIYFVDSSRPGDRRWCSMSACGNKAKVAEFRRRRRSSPPAA